MNETTSRAGAGLHPTNVETSVPADDRVLQLLLQLGDVAKAETLPRFRRTGVGENKAAGTGRGFDPVTEADRASEAAIRRLLAEAAPDDGVLGEEEAAKASSSGITWIVDPIDGTRAFVAGIPLWGTLIARDDGTAATHTLVEHPATGERLFGVHGVGAWITRGEDTVSVRVSKTTSLDDAVLITTAADLFDAEEAPLFEEIRRRVRLTRYGTDCYGYSLVALGTADLVIESGLEAYDIAAPKALVEAAGGIVTDWSGNDCRWGGRTVAAATPALHAQALEILSRI